jgi:hypothetical protein
VRVMARSSGTAAAHRRHLGLAALVVWLAAVAAIVGLWWTAGAACAPLDAETCALPVEEPGWGG